MQGARNGWAVFAACVVATIAVHAQVPGEVTGVRMDDDVTLAWDPTSGTDDYNVYRGVLSWFAQDEPARCHGDEIVPASFTTTEHPDPGEGFFYLVTAEAAAGEGTPGSPTSGGDRATMGRCDGVTAHHILNRLGYGWDEWSRDRLAALGVQGYIDEQLDPLTIDESTNTNLNNRILVLGDPPEFFYQIIGHDMVRSTYARRQLEQHAAEFFNNHFATNLANVYGYFLGLFPPCGDPPLPFCDADYPNEAQRYTTLDVYRAFNGFRDLAFNGNFRDMLEQSFRSPTMIYYLDTQSNIVGNPNENYSREILELHTFGVDNGYTQADIEELARVFTGWEVCRKLAADKDDPVGPCTLTYWHDVAGSEFVANFNIGNHDCTQKVLFAGTPHEELILSTCDGGGLPTAAGVNEAWQALDAIADHPSTAEYVSTKLLQRYVTENPTQTMIDTVVAEWNDLGNPAGRGDLREVMRAVFDLPEFRGTEYVNAKIRTPMEHLAAGFRASRGKTDGVTELINGSNYMTTMQHLPYLVNEPTGYSEIGGDWVGTTNMLERQKFGLQFTTNVDVGTEPNFGADIVPLLNDNGVSTLPGNADAIVDFIADALFGGAITPAERQAALDYLNTDDSGATTPYDDARIKETFGFMLGFARFLEQ